MQNVTIKKSAVALSLGLGLAMGAMSSHTAMAAAPTQYTGWTIDADNDSANVPQRPHVYVAPGGDQVAADTISAFCFNMNLEYPLGTGASDGKAYTKHAGTGDVFSNEATRPRLTGDALSRAVTTVIYNGYGNDAAGIQKIYGLSNDEFYSVTQYAIWYYSQTLPFGQDTSNLTPAMQGAYSALIGDTSGPGYTSGTLVAPPANDTLDIYEHVDADRQNLLGTELVDKDTDQPVNPTAPATTPTQPTAPATTPTAPATTPTAPATTPTHLEKRERAAT